MEENIAEAISEQLDKIEINELENNEITEEDIAKLRQEVEKENKNYPMWQDTIGPHTKNVESFAKELCIGEGLIKEERNKVVTAVIFHDSIKAKPGVDVLDHGSKSAEFAKIKLEALKKDKKIVEEIVNAIERHMNYPFLVNLAKKRGHPDYPKIEIKLDEIVYDSDVLDNIGIKNIAFRLDPEKGKNFITEDIKTAQEQNITQLQAAMENVIFSLKEAVGSLLTETGQRKGKEMYTILQETVKKINYSEIQVGENGQVDVKETMKKLNEEINKLLENKE